MRDRNAVVQPNRRAGPAQRQDDAQAHPRVVRDDPAVRAGFETIRVGKNIADLIEPSQTQHLDDGDAVFRRAVVVSVST